MTAVVGSAVFSDAEIHAELCAAWAEVSRGYARCWATMVEVDRRSPDGWGGEEIAAALAFTARRADYELDTALVLVERLPRVFAAVAAGKLDHHKARIFANHLRDATPEQAEVICERLVDPAAGWTTSQLAARLLRELHAIDPDHIAAPARLAVNNRGRAAVLVHDAAGMLRPTAPRRISRSGGRRFVLRGEPRGPPRAEAW